MSPWRLTGCAQDSGVSSWTVVCVYGVSVRSEQGHARVACADDDTWTTRNACNVQKSHRSVHLGCVFMQLPHFKLQVSIGAMYRWQGIRPWQPRHGDYKVLHSSRRRRRSPSKQEAASQSVKVHHPFIVIVFNLHCQSGTPEIMYNNLLQTKYPPRKQTIENMAEWSVPTKYTFTKKKKKKTDYCFVFLCFHCWRWLVRKPSPLLY